VLPALEWTLSVKYADNFRKMQLELSCKEKFTQREWVLF